MWESAKIAAIFILIGLSIMSGVFSCVTVKCLVAKFGKSKRFKRTISVLNCFAGGVFFATCILDIIPEGREKMEEAKIHWGWTSKYPFLELLVGIGFLMILTLEHCAHTCFRFRHPENSKILDKAPEIPVKAKGEIDILESSVSYRKVNQKPNDYVSKEDNIVVQDFEDSSYFDDVTYKTYGAVDSSLDKTSIRPYSLSPDPRTKNDVEIMFENSDKIVIKQQVTRAASEDVTTDVALQSLANESDNNPSRTNARGIMLLAALSLHMIFDGLALGLLNDTHKVWNLLLALALHKSLVFFTIGLQTLEILKSLRKTIVVICVFSLISPTGIIIGESISSNGDESVQQSAAAILQGIAAGTFIYVTFFEILQREFGVNEHDLWKVLVTIVGFSLIGVLRLLENEDDDG